MNAQRWEYEVVSVKQNFWTSQVDAEKLKQTVNQLGLKGWELAGTSGPQQRNFGPITLIFKRPL